MSINPLTATIYSAPGCMKCRYTKRGLTRLGFTIIEENIHEHPNKIQLMQDTKATELPLVEATIHGEPHTWTGYSDTRMRNLADTINTIQETDQ